MIFQTKRSDSENTDFRALVALLDADLAVRDGAEHTFYAQYNTLVKINHVVLAYSGEIPIACGAMKAFSPTAMEIKRMYTLPGYRGKGIAGAVLSELETWAGELLYTHCLLETGKRQPEAIALYEKKGYTRISNYGQYAGIENSVCFEKRIPTPA